MRRPALATTLALLVLHPAASTPQETPEGASDADTLASSLSGRVLLPATGEPVPAAEVFLLVQDRRAWTDAGGRFLLEDLEPGLEMIQVRVLDQVTPPTTVRIPPGVRVHGDLAGPRAIRSVDEVSVDVRRRRSVRERRRERFRREARGLGRHYLDRTEIRRIDPAEVSDLLPHLALSAEPPGGGPAFPGRGGPPTILGREIPTAGGRGCRPALYVNDVRWTVPDLYTLDVLDPDDVVGMTVYRYPVVPSRYRTAAGRCGVLAVWVEKGG